MRRARARRYSLLCILAQPKLLIGCIGEARPERLRLSLMPKKAAKPRRLYIPVVPAGASWIESDSYDRRAWSDIGLGAPAIRDLVEARPPLVPHFHPLLGAPFFALF